MPQLTTPSISTALLIRLLNDFPRGQVLKAMARHPDPQAALLSGSLQETLSSISSGKKKPGKPAADKGASVCAVSLFDAEFPALLRTIPDPPLVLYFRGDLELLQKATVAVVGARRCTSSGRLLAEQMARDLAGHGLNIVSGLALGIDGAAHRGALSVDTDDLRQGRNCGSTVAILGSGLNRIYPGRHQPLAAAIVSSGGLLLSEYSPSTGPRAHHFPERNRLISGVGGATVVVEASERSGSLITARLALEQGRDVMAVPGPVSSRVSAGCHRLIQQGAALVTNAADILLALGIEALGETNPAAEEVDRSTSPLADLPSLQHQQVLECIQAEPISLDEVCLQTDLPAREVSAIVVSLELMGFVQQVPLGYIRSPLSAA